MRPSYRAAYRRYRTTYRLRAGLHRTKTRIGAHSIGSRLGCAGLAPSLPMFRLCSWIVAARCLLRSAVPLRYHRPIGQEPGGRRDQHRTPLHNSTVTASTCPHMRAGPTKQEALAARGEGRRQQSAKAGRWGAYRRDQPDRHHPCPLLHAPEFYPTRKPRRTRSWRTRSTGTLHDLEGPARYRGPGALYHVSQCLLTSLIPHRARIRVHVAQHETQDSRQCAGSWRAGRETLQGGVRPARHELVQRQEQRGGSNG